jgi:hypothetical protein
VLVDHGARVENVKLSKHLPAIPDWVNDIIPARLMCRHAAIILNGIHKLHRKRVTGNLI